MLNARKPTGEVAWPLLLVEGQEKSGKTFAALSLSADKRVGRTFAFDMGEGTVDEYAQLGPYEVVDHDGTFTSLLAQVTLAAEVPSEEGKPNVIVIDTGTAVWDVLRDGARARARNSRRGQKALREDPDAEVNIGQDLWNEANDRWGRLIRVLRFSPVIGVMVAHGKEVTVVENGVPTQQKGWKVEAQKNLTEVATGWVRMTRPHTATLVGVRSLTVEVPRGGLVLPEENPLAHLVFDVLGAGGTFGRSSAVEPVSEWSLPQAKQRLVQVVADLNGSNPTDMAAAVWKAKVPDGTTAMTDDLWCHLEEAAREAVEA